eukprot:6339916-Prymnesium_polylepis.1
MTGLAVVLLAVVAVSETVEETRALAVEARAQAEVGKGGVAVRAAACSVASRAEVEVAEDSTQSSQHNL